jgi:hypothetical protein
MTNSELLELGYNIYPGLLKILVIRPTLRLPKNDAPQLYAPPKFQTKATSQDHLYVEASRYVGLINISRENVVLSMFTYFYLSPSARLTLRGEGAYLKLVPTPGCCPQAPSPLPSSLLSLILSTLLFSSLDSLLC